MSIQKDEDHKMRLDEIIGLINSGEGFKLPRHKVTLMRNHAGSVLKGLRAHMQKVREPERACAEMGLTTQSRAMMRSTNREGAAYTR
jgi:hypothetical protein